MQINVVDSIMGSGKTSWAIQKMQSNEGSYIYITPFLSEVQRVKHACDNRKFATPNNFGEGKQADLHDLLLKGRDIVSTHALFRLSNSTTSELIRNGNYTLILDEVMSVIEQVPLKKDDVPSMIELGLITIEDNNVLAWNKDKMDYEGKYGDIKTMALNGTLMVVNNVILMWNFPIEIFKMFKEVYILTYMFDGQIQKYYYDLHRLEYKYHSIVKQNEEYILDEYKQDQNIIEALKEKINILDDNINSIGDINYSLSTSWYSKKANEILIRKLQSNVYNFFQNKMKAKGNDIIWTTFVKHKNKIAGKGYSRSFIPLNSRATNEYGNRHHLAYCVNVFLNPIIKQFFIQNKIEVDEDQYALSEMLQWIWRSAIRNNDNIYIYIPSKRMRELLQEWK